MSICVNVTSDIFYIFFFKQKTAYEMRISDWSSDVCSSDLMAQTMIEESGDHILEQHGEGCRAKLDTARRAAEEIGMAERQHRRADRARAFGSRQRELLGKHIIAHRCMRPLLFLAPERKQDRRVAGEPRAKLGPAQILERVRALCRRLGRPRGRRRGFAMSSRARLCSRLSARHGPRPDRWR